MPNRNAKRPRKPIRAAQQVPVPVSVDPLAGRLVIRLKDAFRVIGCGPTKGYELIKDGRLKVTRIDHMTLAYTASIRDLLGLADQTTAT